MKPRLLDLFCGAGGAAMGYHRAGFEVVGVDIRRQPRYPFAFVQADALAFMRREGRMGLGPWRWGFEAIHASPPCQRYAEITAVRGSKADHPDLIGPTRELLAAAALPYVIENVADARRKLRDPVMLCGSAFGLPLRRHRYFESTVTLMSPGCAHGMHAKRYRIRQHGRETDTAFCYVFGGGQAGQPVAAWREAMDIDWMTVDELSQAIPPAYTEHIGHYLMAEINARAAEAAPTLTGGQHGTRRPLPHNHR